MVLGTIGIVVDKVLVGIQLVGDKQVDDILVQVDDILVEVDDILVLVDDKLVVVGVHFGHCFGNIDLGRSYSLLEVCKREQLLCLSCV